MQNFFTDGGGLAHTSPNPYLNKAFTTLKSKKQTGQYSDCPIMSITDNDIGEF